PFSIHVWPSSGRPSPPNSPSTAARLSSSGGRIGDGYECTSDTSPTPLSFHPLALFTSLLGSRCFSHWTYCSVSCCPHPSLNGTHITIDGWIRSALTTCSSS